jgi:hypothetical protein
MKRALECVLTDTPTQFCFPQQGNSKKLHHPESMNFGPDGRIHQKGEIVVFCDTGPDQIMPSFFGMSQAGWHLPTAETCGFRVIS